MIASGLGCGRDRRAVCFAGAGARAEFHAHQERPLAGVSDGLETTLSCFRELLRSVTRELSLRKQFYP